MFDLKRSSDFQKGKRERCWNRQLKKDEQFCKDR